MVDRNMWNAVLRLQDPNLVAKIQKYFGIQVKACPNTISTPSQQVCPGVTKKSEARSFSGGNVNGALVDTNRALKEKDREELFDNGLGMCRPTSVLTNRLAENKVDPLSNDSEAEIEKYVITNLWWYYLFVLGTALGDEIFYASFIPFWLWNIDGAVGRRVVLVWATIMYIGQGIKDIVRWPRPACPPAMRLQKKWALEYGMPSTHAMVGISIPFSVIIYTMNRYQYSVPLGMVIAVSWCTVICISRLYLGMHTVLDVVVGVVLAWLLMLPVVPLVDCLDTYLLTDSWAPVVMMPCAILLIIFYPASDRWTPTRTDTTMVVSVCVGIQLGAWVNYQLGNLTASDQSPPYEIIWPSCSMLGLTVLRTTLGFCCMIATKAVCKSASYGTLCALLRLDPRALRQSAHSMKNTVKATVEVTYTFITYFLLGFNIAYLLPNTFRLLGIERPTFYTEI